MSKLAYLHIFIRKTQKQVFTALGFNVFYIYNLFLHGACLGIAGMP